jgi:glycosyltransferase involved in cell wall biosynthesis
MLQSSAPGRDRVWCAVPVFNNRETVRTVVAECRTVLPRVVVVDDGSTDADVGTLLRGLDVTVLRHETNRGKGAAIRTAARFVEEQGGRFVITIDADGQHAAGDITRFLPLLASDDPVLVIGSRDFNTGNVPGSSRFGRAFGNFWLRVESGVRIGDCQSGFRAYPVRELNRIRCRGARYDFEAEVLARAAWAGIPIREVGISVHYPRPGERMSSFKPFLDNLRLTHTHALLVLRRLLPMPHRRLGGERMRTDWSLLLRPREFFRTLVRQNATPGGLALAAGVGTFIAALPIPFHTGAILYAANRLRLNLLMALNIQHLCMPPFVPALCIEVGFYFRTGRWLTDISVETVFGQFKDRLLEWFLGSLVVAPLLAVLTGLLIYGAAAVVDKLRYANGAKERY